MVDKALDDYEQNKNAANQKLEQEKQAALDKQNAENAGFQKKEADSTKASNKKPEDYWDARSKTANEHYLKALSELTNPIAGHDNFISIVGRMLKFSKALQESLYAQSGKWGITDAQLIGALGRFLSDPNAVLLGQGYDNPNSTLTLPKSILTSATIGEDGVLNLESQGKHLPEDQSLALNILNKVLHIDFLATKGYTPHPNKPECFYNDDGKPLTSKQFDELKTEFELYVNKQGIALTDSGTQLADLPSNAPPVEPTSTYRP